MKLSSSRRLLRLFLLTTLFVSMLTSSVYAESISNLDSDSLVAGWNFENDNGSTAIDETGNYNGTITGTTIVDTEYGKARSFDGVDDYIQFSNPVIPTGEKTIRFRFKSTYNSGSQILLSNSASSSEKNGITIRMLNGELGVFGYKGTAGEVNYGLVYTSKNLCDGNYHDVLFTWDGTTKQDGVRLYVDDLITPVLTAAALSEEPTDTSTSGNLLIGTRSTKDSYFNGEIEEIQIYNESYIPAPQNLTATSGDSRVTLTWNPVEGATEYKVKYDIQSGEPYESEVTVTGAVYATPIESLTNGTTYYFVVTALNATGESINSNEASATPKAEEQPGSGKIMLKTDDGLIYSGDLVSQTDEVFKLKNVYLVNGIPSFTPSTQPTYNWEISFFKNKVIWYYFGE